MDGILVPWALSRRHVNHRSTIEGCFAQQEHLRGAELVLIMVQKSQGLLNALRLRSGKNAVAKTS